MTGFNYDRMQATATRLIARFGKPAVLLSHQAPAQDRPWQTDGSLTAVPITVVVDTYNAIEADGQNVRLTDAKVLIAPGDVAPKVADSLDIDGKVYAVKAVMEHKPGPVLLYWEVQARR